MTSSSAIEKTSHLRGMASSSVPTNDSIIERWLVMPKLLYFLLHLFVYAFHNMMPQFFIKEWGLKEYEYGYMTVITCMTFFGAMFWSHLADRTGRYKTIISLASLAYATIASILLVPIFMDDSQKIYRLTWMISGLALAFFFLSAAFPLLDAQVMGMLAVNPNFSKEKFGNQRLFGSFGHFASTILSSILYKIDKQWGQFSILAASTLLFIPAVIFGVPDVKPVRGGHHHHPQPQQTHGRRGSNKEKDLEKMTHSTTPNGKISPHQVPLSQSLPMAPTPAPPSASDELGASGGSMVKHPILRLLVDPNFLFFMFVVLSAGILRSVMTNFQFYFVQNNLVKSEGEKSVLTTAFTALPRLLSEILVYAISRKLAQKVGMYWLLVFGQFAGIARILGYGLLNTESSMSIWISYVLEFFKGFNSGFISSSAIRIASDIAPPGCESSAQGLYSGNYTGLSMALGGIMSGAIIHYYWNINREHVLQTMFLYTAGLTTVITLLFMAKYIFVDRVMGLPGLPRRRTSPRH